MRKLLAVAFVFGFCSAAFSAQPHNIGSVKASKFSLDQRTIAAINTLTPDTTGQMVLCIDCVRSTVCVSSGVRNAAWVIAVSTGTKGGATFSGFEHCN